jgi:hypothetical protein
MHKTGARAKSLHRDEKNSRLRAFGQNIAPELRSESIWRVFTRTLPYWHPCDFCRELASGVASRMQTGQSAG